MPKFCKFSVFKPKNWPKILLQEASFGSNMNFARSIVVQKSVQFASKVNETV